MKSFLFIFWALGTWLFSACEKTTEEKRQEIIENKLENQVKSAEIEADSLRKEARELENQADALDDYANKMKDSLKNI